MKRTIHSNKLVNLKGNLFLILSFLLVASFIVTACAGAGEPELAEEPPVVAVEEDAGIVEEEPAVVEEEAGVVEEETLAPQMINEFGFYTAQELIGDDVLNADLQDWGKIEDVIIGVDENEIDYAVLDLNDELLEVLDEEAVTLIPLTALSPAAEPEAFFLNPSVNADMLQSAPLFTEDALTNIGDPAWDDEAFGYWETAGLVEPVTVETGLATTTPAFIRASELTGGVASVFDTVGTDIGAIDNILVSVMPDRPNYALMSFGGLTELGDRIFAVPLSYLDFSQFDQGNVIFDADVAMLEQAPLLTDEAFTAPGVVTDPTWDDDFFNFWEDQDLGVTPDVGTEAAMGTLAFVTANELVGDDVMNANMQDWGKIENVLIGVAPNTADYGVLDLSEETLGLADEAGSVLFPLSALSPAAEAEAFYLDPSVSQDLLMNAPVFDTTLVDLTDPTWDDEFFGYWQDAGVLGTDVIGADEMTLTAGQSYVYASELTGASTFVVDTAGETIAEIQNILVGIMPNTADYAVMSFEGFPEIGGRDIVVPMDRLDFTSMAVGNIVFDADMAMLEQAPVLNQEAFAAPGMITDPTWNDEFFEFWETEGIAAVPGTDVVEEGVVGEAVAGEFAFVRAEELIGDDVLNANMQDWGKIEDVIIGIDPNSADYAVLDLSEETLGVVDEAGSVIFPLSALSPAAEPEAFYLDPAIGQDILANAPIFTDADLANLGDPTWDDEAFGYWQNQGFFGTDLIETDQTILPSFVSMNQLNEETVRIFSPADEEIGEIEDVIVSIVPNTTNYALVTFGGFLGLGEDQFVVPLSQMDFTQLGVGSIIFNTDQANLEDAPIFDEALFPGTTAGDVWDDDLAVFWGVEDTTAVQ